MADLDKAALEKAVEAYADHSSINESAIGWLSPDERARLEAAITAYLEHLWRPIDEAPKDGTWVLVCGKESGPVTARYAAPIFNNPIAHAIANGRAGYWHVAGSVAAVEPTHSQPLPAPPKDAST